jgi:hypothetical protein
MSVLKSDCLWKAVVCKVLQSVIASLLTLIRCKNYGTDFYTHFCDVLYFSFPTQTFVAHILNREYDDPNESNEWNVKLLVYTIKTHFYKAYGFILLNSI